MTQHVARQDGTDAPAAQGRRKVFVKSYGCQMNVYDAQRMTDLLAPEGYDETAAIEDADLVVLNTCHIRERATEKIFSELGKVRVLKAERRAAGLDTRVVVAGCVAQAEGGEILRREKAVDVVVGPQSYHNLPRLLAEAGPSRRLVDTDFALDDKFARLPRPTRRQVAARGPAAFLTIQEGCDKFCTFCVVPYTRGAELSRPVAAILDEARALVAHGVREITLLGQNVNGYHGAGADGRTTGLAALCRQLAAIPGLARLRYMTSHPNDLDDELIAAHRDLPALMPFLHLPVQSGSDRILKAMNRKHTAAAYLDAVARLRAARPTSRCRRTSSSASPARPTPISGPRSTSSGRSASPRPSPSSTRPGPARPAPTWPARCPRRSCASASPRCRPWSRRSARPSTRPPWGARSTCCWSGAAAIPASSPARRPISSRCRWTATPLSSARSSPSPSRRCPPIPCSGR